MKTVVEMAEEAGFTVVHEGEPEIGAWYECFTAEIERFAELVRADEREACAKVCDAKALTWRVRPVPMLGYSTELENCSTAIRARSYT